MTSLPPLHTTPFQQLITKLEPLKKEPQKIIQLIKPTLENQADLSNKQKSELYYRIAPAYIKCAKYHPAIDAAEKGIRYIPHKKTIPAIKKIGALWARIAYSWFKLGDTKKANETASEGLKAIQPLAQDKAQRIRMILTRYSKTKKRVRIAPKEEPDKKPKPTPEEKK